MKIAASGRLALLCFIALLVASLTPGVAHAAIDADAPRLNSISIQNPGPYASGDTVNVTWDITEATGLDRAYIDFIDASGSSRYTRVTATLSGATFTLPTTFANGPVRISSVSLYDTANNHRFYYSSGNYAGSGPSGTHTLGLSSVGFEVTGSSADSDAPRLNSISIQNPGPYASGDTVNVTWDITEATGLDRAYIDFIDASGSSRYTRVTATLSGATFTLPTTFANGPVRISSVSLYDTANNHRFYYSSGNYAGSGPSGTHTLGLSSVGFEVTGSSADSDAPRLNSISIQNPGPYAPGDTVNVTWDITEATGLDRAYIDFIDASGSSRYTRVTATLSGATFTLPTTFANGPVRISSVSLYDTADNHRFYYSSGNYAGSGPSGTHTLGLSMIGFRVGEDVPTAPRSVAATASDKTAKVSWVAPEDNGGHAITGYTITASPGGKTATVGGNQTTATIEGLTNGTAYTFTVTATNTIGTSPASGASSSVTPAPPAVAPEAPTGVAARNGTNQATISWNAPTSDGGSPVTGYTATSSPGGKTCTTGGSGRSCTVTGLSNGQPYTFTVTATNSAGTSPTSAPSNSVTPRVDTAAPSLVSSNVSPARVSSAGGTVIVELRVTDDLSGLDGPPVILFKHATSSATFGFGQVSRVSGDANDGTYRRAVTVPAGTAPGDWDLSVYPLDDLAGNGTFFLTRDGVQVGAPGAPSDVTATATADRAVNVTWTAPDDGGNVITAYEVETLPGGKITTVSGTSATIPMGNHPATDPVRYRVRAVNAGGTSDWSAESGPLTIPAQVPDQPTAVQAEASDRTATLSWNAPDNNGSPITGYTVTASPGGKTATVGGNQTTATIEGLTNGTAYTFTVTATNTIGTSPASAASNPVAPRTAPETPTGVFAVRGDQGATVTWSPAGGNGSPVTHYVVSVLPTGAELTVDASQTSALVAGLRNGSDYRFTVAAVSAEGTSSPSTPSDVVTPAGKPGRTARPIGKLKGRTAVITWKAPSANGADIVNFRITSSKGHSKLVGAGARRTKFRSLKPGKITFKVSAINEIGPGRASRGVVLRVRR